MIVDLCLAEAEACVGETEAEGKQRGDAGPVIVPVADEQTFLVAHLAIEAGIDLAVLAVRRIVLPSDREALRKAAPRLGGPVSTSAMALPASWPGYQACSTAATSRSTASRPGRRSAARRWCAGWLPRLRRSVRPAGPARRYRAGRFPRCPTRRCDRRRPAPRQLAAAATASAMASSPSGRPMPTRKAARPSVANRLASRTRSRRRSCGPPRASMVPTTSSQPSSKNVRPFCQWLHASATSTPSMRTRAVPAL